MELKAIMEALQSPFEETEIEWRVQRAMRTRNGDKAVVLAYVTNRAIQNRLDELFGIAGWRNEYKEMHEGILCGISIRLDGEWITKWDGADITNIEPTKGGLSNSMKRAAVQWGMGRYLYNLPETWVDIKERGQNYIKTKIKIGNNEEWIEGYWDTPKLPAWALPEKQRKNHNNSQPSNISLDSVLSAWKAKGGTEEQFDEFIKDKWKITDRTQLKPNHLVGIQRLIEQKKGA